MYLSKKNWIASVVLLAVVPAQAQFPEIDVAENLIPQWLPQCFDGAEAVNPFEVVDCIRSNSKPTCVQQSFQESIMDIVQCVNISMTDQLNDLVESFTGETATSRQGGNGNPLQEFLQDVAGIDVEELVNIGRVFVNSTLECLDPYASCVQETIQEAMQTQLDPCINQTLVELLECGRANQDLCYEACSNVSIDAQINPFEGLGLDSVETCDGIQTNLMNPLCEVVGCCEPCVPKVEALMQCLVNQQLDQVPAVGDSNTCQDLTCPAMPSRRQLRTATITTTASSSRNLQEKTTTPEDCLQYSPGLTGDDTKEFSARSAVFLPCVSDLFLEGIQEPAAVVAEETSSGVRAGSMGLVAIMAVAYMVL